MSCNKKNIILFLFKLNLPESVEEPRPVRCIAWKFSSRKFHCQPVPLRVKGVHLSNVGVKTKNDGGPNLFNLTLQSPLISCLSSSGVFQEGFPRRYFLHSSLCLREENYGRVFLQEKRIVSSLFNSFIRHFATYILNTYQKNIFKLYFIIKGLNNSISYFILFQKLYPLSSA